MNKIIISIFIILSFLSSFAKAEVNKELKDLSIIMPSYDKYSELWIPAFELLFKNWPNLNTKYRDIPVYLMSNEEKFDHPRVTSILVGEADKGWSSNFLKALESVKTKYVLIILDDYIVDTPVNDQRLVDILKLMRDTKAAYTEIALDISLNDGPLIEALPGILIRDRFGIYRTSLQTCVWETEILKRILKPGESIWDFELIANLRTQGLKEPFYLVTKDPVFHYKNAVEKGKYDKNVVEYINKQGIKFNPIKLPIKEQ